MPDNQSGPFSYLINYYLHNGYSVEKRVIICVSAFHNLYLAASTVGVYNKSLNHYTDMLI